MRKTTTVIAYVGAPDEHHLSENIAQADGHEVQQRQLLNSACTTRQSKRNDEESQHCQCRNRQQREQHEHPHVHFPIHALPCPGGMKDVGELQREKEERLIVGHGSNVERVSRRVNGCIASCNQSKKFLVPGLQPVACSVCLRLGGGLLQRTDPMIFPSVGVSAKRPAGSLQKSIAARHSPCQEYQLARPGEPFSPGTESSLVSNSLPLKLHDISEVANGELRIVPPGVNMKFVRNTA